MNKEEFKFKIYLAGYNGDVNYRKEVISKYGDKINFVDPMTITFDDIYSNINYGVSDIYLVKRDKKLIDYCDILVAKVEFLREGEISIGTYMEIMYAYMKGIPVFLISSSDELLENPWLKFHSSAFFNTIDECFENIIGKEIL